MSSIKQRRSHEAVCTDTTTHTQDASITPPTHSSQDILTDTTATTRPLSSVRSSRTVNVGKGPSEGVDSQFSEASRDTRQSTTRRVSTGYIDDKVQTPTMPFLSSSLGRKAASSASVDHPPHSTPRKASSTTSAPAQPFVETLEQDPRTKCQASHPLSFITLNSTPSSLPRNRLTKLRGTGHRLFGSTSTLQVIKDSSDWVLLTRHSVSAIQAIHIFCFLVAPRSCSRFAKRLR